MPYSSNAQRRFFHTDTAKKKGITEDEVNEFDKASKGMKLPEKKMADGGEVPEMQDDKFTKDVQEGFKNGINGDWNSIKAALSEAGNKLHDNYEKAMGDEGNLKGLQNIADKKAGMAYGGETNAKHETLSSMKNNPTAGFADGGDVMDTLGQVGSDIMGAGKGAINAIAQYNPLNMLAQGLSTQTMNNAVNPQGVPPTPPPDQSFITQLNAGTAIQPPAPAPASNPISTAAQTATNLPPTNPGIYQGITAQDRAGLMQQLLAQKSSPGILAAKGAAGLGDAITSAFGKAPTQAMQGIREGEQQNIAQRANVMDVQREQRMQDFQAKMAVASADPNSPVSAAYRAMGKIITGKTFPSGVSAAQIDKFMPLIGKQLETSTQAYIAQGEQGVNASKEQFGESPFKQFIEWAVGAQQPGEGGLVAAQNKAFPGTATPGAGASMQGWGNVRRSQ
jgi:hypothetical protein